MPTHKIKQADRAGSSTVLPVGEVVAIVREWVDLHARHLPDFAGAYLWGGITALPADAPFHLYRDVDLVVVSLPAEDTAFGWDYPALRNLLQKRGIPHACLFSNSCGPVSATDQERLDMLMTSVSRAGVPRG